MGTLIMNQHRIFDTDAINYINAVEIADGQALELNTRIALDSFIKGCKRDGIWNAIKDSCILCSARTLNGALIPLKGTAPTNFNFVSGDYNRKTGLKGNGVNKYLNLNKLENSYPRDSFSFGFYASEYIVGTTTGVRQIGIAGVGFNVLSVNGITNFRNRGGVNPTEVPSVANGFYSSSRSSNLSVQFQINSNSFLYSFSSSVYNDEQIGLFTGLTSAGTTNNLFSSSRISFYFLGEHLNLELLNTRVSQLMTNINNAF
jgi:hypothetical protein